MPMPNHSQPLDSQAEQGLAHSSRNWQPGERKRKGVDPWPSSWLFTQSEVK
jgi:hypothetical protein